MQNKIHRINGEFGAVLFSYIPKYSHHRQERLPLGSKMDLVAARLVRPSILRHILVQLLIIILFAEERSWMSQVERRER